MENNTVTERQEATTISDIAQHKEKKIETPIFIIFAEYLGYVSRFNELAVNWCEGKVPEVYIQKLLMMEAKSIFRQMLKDYTLEKIQYWYDTYYPVIICEYEEKLSKAVAASDED